MKSSFGGSAVVPWSSVLVAFLLPEHPFTPEHHAPECREDTPDHCTAPATLIGRGYYN